RKKPVSKRSTVRRSRRLGMIMRIASATFRARPSRGRHVAGRYRRPFHESITFFGRGVGPKSRVWRALARLLECWHDFLSEAAKEGPIERRAEVQDHFGRPGVRIGAEPVPDRARTARQDRLRHLLLDQGAGAQPDGRASEWDVRDGDER